MRTLLALCTLSALGCGLRNPGMVTGGRDDAEAVRDDRSVETFASPLEVAAGDVVTVRCVVRRGDEHLAQELTGVSVLPTAGAVVDNGDGGFDFSPTTAGTYDVRCRTADGAVEDTRGVRVTVTPAPAASVETTLSADVALAGAPVEVVCDVVDAFGNLLEEERGSGVDVDAELLVDPPIGAGFVVRGTAVGEYGVACRHDTLVDETPEILTVVPGIPGASETVVDTGAVLPGEEIAVTCSVTDAFGNALDGIDSDFVVLTVAGTAPDADGFTQSADTFVPTLAGIYYVFCIVPGSDAGDETPAVVRVRAGLPCTWVVDVVAEDCYWQGRRLPVDFEVFDFWGNRVEDATIEMSATPSIGIVQDGPTSWIFTDEGDFDLSFGITGALDDANCSGLLGYVGIPESVSIRVDSTGPVLNVLPARADMFVQDDVADTPVTIAGSVSDSLSTIVSASVNGVDLGADGSASLIPISLTQTSRWGTTIVSGVAEDACGNRSVLAQSYVRSGDTAQARYFAAATVPAVAARAPQGIFAQLNQVVLDDFDRSDLDDLASIGAVILQDQDFNALVAPGDDFTSHYHSSTCGTWCNDPGCVFGCGCACCPWELGCDTWADIDYLVERPNNSAQIVVEGPYIDYLRAIDGGLSFRIGVGDSSPGHGFEFPLRLWARDRECLCGIGPTTLTSIDTNGVAYADSITVTGTMAVTLAGGAPVASAPTLSISTSGLGFDLSCPGWIDWLCDWVVDILVDQLTGLIEDALADVISNELPPLVEEMLSGFALEDGFDIPPPLDMRLEMSSGLDWLVFCGPAAGIPKPAQCPASSPNPGYGQIGLFSQIFPNARGANIPGSAPGAIKKSGTRPPFSASNYEFGMGIKDDMFNQILWALWYGGGLDLDADTMSGIVGGTGFSGIEMSLFFETPPVAMPGRDGWELQLGIGDAYVDATVDLAALLGGGGGGGQLHVGLYLSTVIGGSLDINAQNELVVSLDADPQIFVQVVDIDDPGYQAVMSDIFVEILRLILPNLISSVLSSFPIPEIDLSGIVNLPPGTDAVWSFTNASIARESDYYVITGSLQ